MTKHHKTSMKWIASCWLTKCEDLVHIPAVEWLVQSSQHPLRYPLVSVSQVRGHLRPGSLGSPGPGQVAHGAGHRLRVAEPRLSSSEFRIEAAPQWHSVENGKPQQKVKMIVLVIGDDYVTMSKSYALATLVREGGNIAEFVEKLVRSINLLAYFVGQNHHSVKSLNNSGIGGNMSYHAHLRGICTNQSQPMDHFDSIAPLNSRDPFLFSLGLEDKPVIGCASLFVACWFDLFLTFQSNTIWIPHDTGEVDSEWFIPINTDLNHQFIPINT